VIVDGQMHALGDLVRRLQGQLQLVRADDRYELQDASGEHVLGAVDGISEPDARAEVSGSSWLLCVERARGRWQIVARTTDSGDAAACYYPGALAGGRIWVAPDSWGKLRKTQLQQDISWGLTIDDKEVMRVWPEPPEYRPESFEIVVGDCSVELPQLPLLLIPLVCWIVMTEDSLPAWQGGGGP
jgi:hypothetical protein